VRWLSLGKALVVYDSVYGNTEKVARALAKGMEDGKADVDCVRIDAVKFDELSGYDLLVVGSPVHAWSASKPTIGFLERLKSVQGLNGKKAFAFDTKMSKSRLAGNAGGKIERKLKSLDLTIVKPHVSAVVKGREGPLEEGTEETFKQLGVELAKMM
jgi:flavodoxin